MMTATHGPSITSDIVDVFEATDLGAPFKVILHCSVKVAQNEAGEVTSYSIPDLDGLIRAVVISRVLHPRKLNGADIKFIRRAIGIKQKDLSTKIEVSVEHLSRYETGAQPISPSSEKLLRIFALKTALKLHKMKSCEEKTKLEDALDRLFDGMKPVSVFDTGKPLELHFHRSRAPNSSGDDGTDDGHWDGDLDEAA